MEDRILNRLTELEKKLDLILYKVELYNLNFEQDAARYKKYDEIMNKMQQRYEDDGK